MLENQSLKKRIFGKTIKVLFLLILSWYIGSAIVNQFFIKPQLFIDTAKWENQDIKAYTYHAKSTEVKLEKISKEEYKGEINWKWGGGSKYSVKLRLKENRITGAEINGREVKQSDILQISEYVYGYVNIYAIYLDPVMPWRIGIQILVVILCFLTLLRLLKKYQYKLMDFFMYRGKAFIYEKRLKKYVLISFLLSCLTIAIYYGVDVGGIVGGLNLTEKNLDIYQLSAAIDVPLNNAFYMMPYNMTLVKTYHFLFLLNKFFLNGFDPKGYLIIQAIMLKLINMLFINLTVISIINFLLDTSRISKDKVKSIYIFSIYNPLTFYIAIIYIQLDMVTIYFFTIGILKFYQLKKEWFLSAIFIAMSLATKMQSLILIPAMLSLSVFYLFTLLKKMNKIEILEFLKFLSTMIITFFVCIGFPILFRYPIYYMLKDMPQTSRMSLGFVYSPGVYLYLAFFFALIFFSLNFMYVNLSKKLEDIILNSLMLAGILPLAFSFGILHTPSIFLLTLPCFVIFYSKEDVLSNFVLAVIGIFPCFTEIFSIAGDITASLKFFGREGFFIALEYALREIPENWHKYSSILFTVSHTGMMVLAIRFNLFTIKNYLQQDLLPNEK